jgi:hypothetical protein
MLRRLAWRICVTASLTLAALLVATSDVLGDSAPPQGEGQVVTIIVPALKQKTAPKKQPTPAPTPPPPAPAPPPPPPAPAPPPATPARTHTTARSTPRRALPRGGPSKAVVVPPPARGGASTLAIIPRARHEAPVAPTAAVRPPDEGFPHWAGALLALLAFGESALLVRFVRRRRVARELRRGEGFLGPL